MSHWLFRSLSPSPAYERVRARMAEAYVLLDGGVASELARVAGVAEGAGNGAARVRSASRTLADVREVHRRYVEAGCDVISTNTWAILHDDSPGRTSHDGLPGWTEGARTGLRVAREAVAEAGRTGSCAVAFCINDDLSDPQVTARLESLTWVWAEDPPDLVILETLDAFPSEAALEHLAMVVELGLPVWLSFRMNAGGFCDTGGRQLRFFEPGRLANAMRGLEHADVDALLVNCLPAPLVADAVRTLKATTHVPLGCYPNAAHGDGETMVPEGFAWHVERARQAGARILGGCCGAGPEHVRALAGRLATTETYATARLDH